MKYCKDRVQEVVSLIGQRMIAVSRFDAAADIFESVGYYEKAIDCFVQCREFKKALSCARQVRPQELQD
jgi:hypothetical protein